MHDQVGVLSLRFPDRAKLASVLGVVSALVILGILSFASGSLAAPAQFGSNIQVPPASVNNTQQTFAPSNQNLTHTGPLSHTLQQASSSGLGFLYLLGLLSGVSLVVATSSTLIVSRKFSGSPAEKSKKD
jgi:hypothetical protein